LSHPGGQHVAPATIRCTGELLASSQSICLIAPMADIAEGVGRSVRLRPVRQGQRARKPPLSCPRSEGLSPWRAPAWACNPLAGGSSIEDAAGDAKLGDPVHVQFQPALEDVGGSETAMPARLWAQPVVPEIAAGVVAARKTMSVTESSPNNSLAARSGVSLVTKARRWAAAASARLRPSASHRAFSGT
jgi:hypothetical protein